MPAAEPHTSVLYGRAAIRIGAALSMTVCAAVAAQWILIGSVTGGWFYGYAQPLTIRILAVALLASASVGALLWAGSERRDWISLVIWIAVALLFQWGLRAVAPFSLESVFVSEGANSFYTVTQQHEPWEVLRRFSRVQAQAPLHAQSNMPGKVMLLYALQLVSARTDVVPWLLIVLSNLGALLMYVFTRDLLADRRAALFAAILYLFVPARIYFLPLMNTITPVAVLACACLLLRWVRTGATVYAVLLGLALYVLVFFEPLPLVIGLLFAALAAAAIARGDITWQRFAVQTAAMVVAFIAAAEAMALLSGFRLVPTLERIAEHATAFNVEARRPYGVWVRANLAEFAFGAGVCQAALFPAAIVTALHGGAWRETLARPIAAFSLGLLATLLVTNLLGVNRGEVIRLWIFLACFLQIPAAYLCAALGARRAIALVGFTTTLQAALGLAMIRFVVP